MGTLSQYCNPHSALQEAAGSLMTYIDLYDHAISKPCYSAIPRFTVPCTTVVCVRGACWGRNGLVVYE